MFNAILQNQKYEQHRYRVENAKCEVNHNPPIIHAGNFVGLSNLRDDQENFQVLQGKQFNTMVSINRAERTKGNINTFEPCIAQRFVQSKLVSIIRCNKLIEKANEDLGQRILNAKPEVITHHPKKEFTLKEKRISAHKKKESTFVIPEKILKKYKDVNLPKDEHLLHKLLRPKIYFEVEAVGVLPLGPIVMELYTEACPQVVLEFVRVCLLRSVDSLKLVRSFPELWLEGKLLLKHCRRKVGLTNIEYDMRALDHGSSVGIMSIPHANLKGFPTGYIPFAISYKPLRVANGNRLAFGKVISGIKNLNCLQDYGTKNGKPSKELKIKSCGIFI